MDNVCCTRSFINNFREKFSKKLKVANKISMLWYFNTLNTPDLCGTCKIIIGNYYEETNACHKIKGMRGTFIFVNCRRNIFFSMIFDNHLKLELEKYPCAKYVIYWVKSLRKLLVCFWCTLLERRTFVILPIIVDSEMRDHREQKFMIEDNDNQKREHHAYINR